jgi:hypothetical protein
MKSLILFLLTCLLAVPSYAQCPGGVCPTPRRGLFQRTYTQPTVRYSQPQVTYSQPQVTYSQPSITIVSERVITPEATVTSLTPVTKKSCDCDCANCPCRVSSAKAVESFVPTCVYVPTTVAYAPTVTYTSSPVPTCNYVFSPVPRSRNHWTYPGTISGHLQSGHGVNPAGMSREQMLNLHDALHEGR